MKKQLDEWSRNVKIRDGNKCVMCQGIKTLNSHHILPYKYFKEYRFDLDNGITLCPSCHRLGKYAAHQNAVYFVAWLCHNRPQLYDIANMRLYESIRKW